MAKSLGTLYHHNYMCPLDITFQNHGHYYGIAIPSTPLHFCCSYNDLHSFLMAFHQILECVCRNMWQFIPKFSSIKARDLCRLLQFLHTKQILCFMELALYTGAQSCRKRMWFYLSFTYKLLFGNRVLTRPIFSSSERENKVLLWSRPKKTKLEHLSFSSF